MAVYKAIHPGHQNVGPMFCMLYLINIPEPVQYHIHAMVFPFDLRCESRCSGSEKGLSLHNSAVIKLKHAVIKCKLHSIKLSSFIIKTMFFK